MLRIAYFTSMFARPSDTFVRGEVNLLRALGDEVFTFSTRRPDRSIEEEPDVTRHQERTEYLVEAGWPALVLAAWIQAAKHPLTTARVALLALQTAPPGLSGAVRQAAYFVEAAYLARRLRALEVQHLHNHIGENSATIAMLASAFSGIPFSLTIHGPGIFYAPEKWALGTKLARASFTACISHFCRSQCLTFAPLEAQSRLHVVRCGAPVEFLPPPAPRVAAGEVPCLVCVGRLCVEKGHRQLIEAAARLRAQGRRFRLAMVGDGPLRGELEGRIAELGLGECVEILGWQTTGRVRELLLEAHAFVLPSFAEGLPIVLMEALALECPVVTTTVAAIPELVEHGQMGWLTPPSDLEALTAALGEALELTPERRAEMGRAGRSKVLASHHPERQVEQLRALIEAAKPR